jgi:hypothetical protein
MLSGADLRARAARLALSELTRRLCRTEGLNVCQDKARSFLRTESGNVQCHSIGVLDRQNVATFRISRRCLRVHTFEF